MRSVPGTEAWGVSSATGCTSAGASGTAAVAGCYAARR